jgi:hypothetical protein
VSPSHSRSITSSVEVASLNNLKLIYIIYTNAVTQHVPTQLNQIHIFTALSMTSRLVALGGLVVIVLAVEPKVCVFKPNRGRWIFKGNKNP